MSTSKAERNTQLRDGSLSRLLISSLAPSIFNSNWFGPKGSAGNKYKPHQGAQEIARRLRGKPESKPRRMWHINTVIFGAYMCKKRSSLMRLRFAKTLGCRVVMLP